MKTQLTYAGYFRISAAVWLAGAAGAFLVDVLSKPFLTDSPQKMAFTVVAVVAAIVTVPLMGWTLRGFWPQLRAQLVDTPEEPPPLPFPGTSDWATALWLAVRALAPAAALIAFTVVTVAVRGETWALVLWLSTFVAGALVSRDVASTVRAVERQRHVVFCYVPRTTWLGFLRPRLVAVAEDRGGKRAEARP